MPATMTPSRIAACAVIPVYNHEHAIGAVVEKVIAQGLPVILIDDGSSDACARELDRLSQGPSVTLERHPKNRGKGAAVVTGMRAARERGFTHALQIDADGQHALADIPRFLAEADMYPRHVICGRPVFDESIPKARYYGRYLTHGMVWFETLSLEIRDSMCGFRLYPLALVTRLLEPGRLGTRMDFDTEILVRLYWRDIHTRWIDTRVTYPADGVSHFRMLRDNLRMISLHIRLSLGMILRLPILLARKIRARGAPSTQ